MQSPENLKTFKSISALHTNIHTRIRIYMKKYPTQIDRYIYIHTYLSDQSQHKANHNSIFLWQKQINHSKEKQDSISFYLHLPEEKQWLFVLDMVPSTPFLLAKQLLQGMMSERGKWRICRQLQTTDSQSLLTDSSGFGFSGVFCIPCAKGLG